MTVVDASIVVRLLQNRQGDEALRERFGQHRYVHAPSLIDAEVVSAVRGLLLTAKPALTIKVARAEEMLDDFADLPLVRYPMRPYQQRALMLRRLHRPRRVLRGAGRVARHAPAHRRPHIRQGRRARSRRRNLAVEFGSRQ